MYRKSDVIEVAKIHCKENGKTAASFARECGISESQMQYYFRGGRTPNDEQMEKICFALRLPSNMIEKDAPKKAVKVAKDSKPNTPNGMYRKGNAIVDDFMRHAEITNRSLANTILVMIAWDAIIYRGVQNIDFEPYIKEVNNG